MANTFDKWYFTKEQLDQTPSRECGYDGLKELSYRQQTANFIQDMGQRLKVSQLCINTAIVYMHRFYVFHSFTHFPWHQMAAAALFLAAKVEEQPRKLEYVIRVANICRNNRDTLDINSERYQGYSQDLVFNENVLLQTLGFDVAIDHPHTHVVRCCHLVRASKDLAQSSYFLASNSLHLTTMCLQYKPTVVACFCIHLACKWSRWEIPLSTEKKEWFLYVDPTVTADLLHQLTTEFFSIFESCPSRLKEKIMSIGDNGMHSAGSSAGSISNSPFDTDPKKLPGDSKDPHFGHQIRHNDPKMDESHKHRSTRPPHDQAQREREYREKKEREKLAAVKQAGQLPLKQPVQQSGSTQPTPSLHHRNIADPKLKQHAQYQQQRPATNTSTMVTQPSGQARPHPRDILREATRDPTFGIATKSDVNGKEQVKITPSRDYLLKPNVAADTNNYFNGEKRSINGPTNRVTVDPKLQQQRHNVDQKYKDMSDLNKRQPINNSSSSNSVQSGHDRNNLNIGYIKTTNTSQQAPAFKKSPLLPPPQQSAQQPQKQKSHSNGAFHHQHHPSQPNEPIIKRPSLFSPEKSPSKQTTPITQPLEKRVVASRNFPNNSEAELRPVLKKIEQVEGFENVMTSSLNRLHQIPDIITPISDSKPDSELSSYLKGIKPPDIIPPLISDVSMSGSSSFGSIIGSQPLVNGMETNPQLISSLLKETPPAASHLTAVMTAGNVIGSESKDGIVDRHKSHKSKKKNKEKHKHKDKDRTRDEKEKKKKHKDKDREKHKHREEIQQPIITEPIKIKIHKDKIQLPTTTISTPTQPNNPLKIKISKDVINKSEEQPATSFGLKIKIPRDKISNCAPPIAVDGEKSVRKRDRSSPGDGPPVKMSKSISKQNGRHSAAYNNKVTQMGDGDASMHMLAESKYMNKNSTM